MCVNNLSKVALDSVAAGIEPATSSCKSNALTTAPPSHTESRQNQGQLYISSAFNNNDNDNIQDVFIVLICGR